MAVGGVAADVIADGSEFGPSLQRVLARHRNETIDVDVQLSRDSLGRLRDARGRFVAEGRRAGSGFGQGFERSAGAGISRALRDIGSQIGSISASIGRVAGMSTGFLLIGASAAVATGQIIAFVAALAPAVGILAGLPAAFGVAVAGIATLTVALRGMGDAFSAALGDDVAAFEEALEGIAPAAADTARALRDVAPAWRDLQRSVQDAFFAGFADELRDISDVLVGPLQAGMTSAASALSGLVTGFADVAASAASVEFISGSFTALSNVIDNVSGPLSALLASLIAVGNAVNEAFGGESAGSGLAGMIQQLADFLDAAAAGGDAVSWVESAMTVFSQLGAILAPIGGILSSIGSAASSAGGSILGAFGTALQAIDDFLASAEGAAFLTELFATLGDLGGALGPVFSALGSALTPLLGTAGDLVQILGPGLTTLINALGDGLAAAAPSLLVLGDAVVSLVEAAAPLLPILGEWLGSLIELGASLLTGLVPAVEVAVGLLEAFSPILPAVIELANVLVESMIPAWEQWADSAGLLLGPLSDIVSTLVAELMPVALELLPLIGDLAMVFSEEFGQAIIDALPAILQLTSAFVEFAQFALPPAVEGAKILAQALGGLITIVGTVIGWFIDLGAEVFQSGQQAGRAIQDFVNLVRNGFNQVKGWIDDVVSWFAELPGRILGAIGNLGDQIWGSITSSLGDIGEFFGFANGGIITSPTVAALAEDGRPEVVIPLTKPARAQQLAAESGLTQILNVGSSEPRSPVNVVINVHGGDLREVRRTIEDVMAEYA